MFDTPDPGLSMAANHIRLEIELHHCTDVMSGEIYDGQVIVHLDNNVYRGCGLALEPW